MRIRLAVLLLATVPAFAGCHDGDDEPGASGAGGVPDAEVMVRAADGVPTFVGGDLGRAPADLDLADAEAAMAPILAQVAPLFAGRADQLRLVSVKTDDIGYLHLRYRQE